MEDEEYKKLPVEDRCVHKLWKARISGYEDVTKLFRQIDDEKSPEFSKYLGLVKKFVTDNNALGQEKGLEATLAYIENYAHAYKTVGDVMGGIVTKCIAAPKARTRELALQITLMYIEIEKFDVVQEELLKGMEQKNPKISAACINASTTALREFGAKVINVKLLIKKIPVLFADRDKTVRDEARQMVVEIFRWIGGALRSQLNNLQPVQVTELEAEFAKIEGQKAVPTRYIRSQQQKQAAIVAEADDVEAGGSDAGEDDECDTAIDPYDLADPVDILSKLPKDFYEKVEAKKWQERKEALEALENLLKTPKLQSGEYGDLVRALKKIIEKDSNVVVVALGGKCLAALASGLKKRFQTYAGACVSSLLEKFKEKKQNVVLAIKDAIDAIYLTTTMEAILEDVIEALGNKNPSVKAETSFFLARSFSKTQPSVFNKKMLKTLTTALIKIINEPDPTVRDASAEAIGTLMKLVGEKAIMPFLVELEKDNLKMAKIRECSEKAVITVKVSGGATSKKERPATAPTAKSGAKVVKPSVGAPKSAPNVTTNKASGKKRAEIPSSGSATIVLRPKGKSSKASSAAKSLPIERELSEEEAEEIAANIVNATTLKELLDANWKTRLAVTENLLKDVQALDVKEVPTQALIKILSKKPGLKDTNFQVLKAKVELIKYLAENCTFSTTSVNLCINELTEKFGDPKNGVLVGETMTAMAEATSLAHVSVAVIEIAMNQKNPKVTQEALVWLTNAVKEFGFANLNAKLFIDNAKKALASTNPQVRQTAITFCGVLFLYMGPPIYTFFENEKPALRDQINAECEKYEGEKPPSPIRGKIKGAQSIEDGLDVNDDEEEAAAEAQVVNVSDLIPRVDISSQLTESLINELDDKNWKVRNEALTKLNNILAESKFIKPNLGDLPPALAKRLSDSNTKIAQSSLNLCEALAKAMGPPCKQYVKVFFPCFLQNLGDNKSWMRTTAKDTIEAFAEQGGLKEFFENEMVADALKSGSPVLRIELWLWLAEKLPKIPPKAIAKEEIVVCIPHLFSNLEDRNADVRKNAQEAILGIMIHVGYEAMVRQTEKLKPGSKNVIMQQLDKVRPNLPVKPLAKKLSEKESKVVKSGGAAKLSTSNSAQQMQTAGGAAAAAGNKNTTVRSRSSIAVNKPGAAVSGRKKDEDIDTSPLFVVNNLKHQRTIDESKLKVLKWNFTTPREEFVELLRDQMTAANVNKTLLTNMFHIDFRYHIKALESLTEDLATNGQALIANLDLVLKWLTLRFFDTNPSVLLKGLEYLQLVFNMLIETRYRMLENEAASFLPYLIIKIGDPKDSVRNGVRALFKQIPQVYAISRFVSYIMEGIKSKNARQRAECLEALDNIIEGYGINVFVPSPAACLKEVAKQISDRDNSVRNAALNCVVAAYLIVGDKVYKMLGNISDKDLSLLEERIKRSNRRTLTKPLKVDLPHQSPIQQQQPHHHHQSIQIVDNDNNEMSSNADGDNMENNNHENNEDDEQVNLPPVIMPKISEPKEPQGPFHLDDQLMTQLDQLRADPVLLNIREFDLAFLNSDVNIPKLNPNDIKAKILPLSPPKPLDLNLALTKLTDDDNDENEIGGDCGGKLLGDKPPSDPILMSTFNKISSPDPNTFADGIHRMTEYLQSKYAPTTMPTYETEFFNSIVNQLRHLRNSDYLQENISGKMYRDLLTAIDLFYNVKTLGQHVATDTLKEIMNELIHVLVAGKIEHCPTGDAYIRVINLHCVKIIERSNHTKIICALVKLMHECVQLDNSSRHTELVMKCLWRVIKLMPNWGEDVDYDCVLLEVHNFLKEFPSSWWANKPQDTTLRTMKTILHSSVKIKKGAIMLHFGKIPNTSESEIETYVLKLLKTMNLEAIKPNSVKSETTGGRVTLSRRTQTRLTEIFQKIGNKDETKEGLNLLYDFMQQHPEADVEPFLKKCSKFFQDYIKNGLQSIENSRQASKSSIEEKVAQTLNPPSNRSTSNTDDSLEYWTQKLNYMRQLVHGPSSTDALQ